LQENPLRFRQTGFTLLEVLLGMVLSIALMTGLWASLNLYTKIFNSGHLQVEQSQLIRGVLTKLSVEIRAAVIPSRNEESSTSVVAEVDPMALTDSSQLESSGCCGLRGDAHWIEIDLVEPRARAILATTFDNPSASALTTPTVPELITVRYYVAETDLVTPITDGIGLANAAGLVRFARPWPGHPGANTSGQAFSSSSQGRSNTAAFPDAVDEASPAGTQRSPINANENTPQLLAAEVVQLEFRYFDGQSWVSQWDSGQTGAIPQAVEVALATRRPRNPSRSHQHRQTSNGTPTDNLTTEADASMRGVSLFETSPNSSSTEQLPWVISRRLIALPVGGNPPDSRSMSNDDEPETNVSPMPSSEPNDGGESDAEGAP